MINHLVRQPLKDGGINGKERSMKNIVVVGGANIDIVAAPDGELRAHDSMPGHSSVSFGGVGRNIAENLVMLGCRVRFVTVFGNDSFSRTLRADIMEKGIDVSLSKSIRGAACSKYICINDSSGELYAAINDMSVYEHMGEVINPETISAINEADLVVLDSNTSKEDLERIVSQCSVPIAFDAVSLSKVGRCRDILDRIFLFKPNIYEAEELLKDELADMDLCHVPDDIPSKDKAALSAVEDREAADGAHKTSDSAAPDTEKNGNVSLADRARLYAGLLRKKGVKNVMLSLGAEGVYYENESESGVIPSMAKSVVNTSGCGDAFLAGAISASLEGEGISGMARYGSAAAAICAESERTISRRMSMERIKAMLHLS